MYLKNYNNEEIKKILDTKIIYFTSNTAKSGMSAKYRLYYTFKNEIIDITKNISDILDEKLTKNHEITVKGCGFNRVNDILARTYFKISNKSKYNFNICGL